MDGASVKKQFFCKRRLAGIRVGNDGKGTASLYFFQISHVSPQK